MRLGWAESAEDIIGQTLGAPEGAIERTAAELPANCPPEMADAIFRGARSQARRLEAQPPA